MHRQGKVCQFVSLLGNIPLSVFGLLLSYLLLQLRGIA